MTNRQGSGPDEEKKTEAEPPRQMLSAAAKRALEEAELRRAKQDAEAAADASPAKEIDGVEGPEPVRYGDWENNGRASDF